MPYFDMASVLGKVDDSTLTFGSYRYEGSPDFTALQKTIGTHCGVAGTTARHPELDNLK